VISPSRATNETSRAASMLPKRLFKPIASIMARVPSC
jgi:hypothetical protein